ncbi:MAG: ABC transporter ATP-binding protein [Desulfarculus sp.]|jgi:branched-chain amino acid transport system ATP-binding protein|nr:MAG: ABC transporter ATP-binding protein [Desulfarculus sp.]
MEPILTTKDLSRHFGGVLAVNLVSLNVYDRQVHSIIGPNGAGKTTLINVITGRLGASEGQVLYQGRDITHRPVYERVRQGISRTFQITSIFMGLSVQENVRIAVQSHLGGSLSIFKPRGGLTEVNAKTGAILERVGLTDVNRQPANSLAHGDQRVLEVAIALAGDPKVLLLDEPAAGMSPAETDQISELISALGKEMAVVLVEHDMEVVMKISEHITVLHQGGVIARGTPREIASDKQVRDAYLGGDQWAPLTKI